MKKIAYLALSLVALSSQAAGPTPYFDGIMIGGAIGATAAQFQLSQNNVYPLVPAQPITDREKVNLFANTPMILVSLGYSYQADNAFTVGGYFTAAYSDAKSTDSKPYSFEVLGFTYVIDTQTITQLTNDFALMLKGGYVWKRTTHFYGLAGPRWGNFHSQITTAGIDHVSQFIQIPPIEFSESVSASEYVLGYTMGLGIQQLLTPRYSWALEYNYTTYGTLTMPDTDFNFSNAKSQTNTLMFMIEYRM